MFDDVDDLELERRVLDGNRSLGYRKSALRELKQRILCQPNSNSNSVSGSGLPSPSNCTLSPATISSRAVAAGS